MMDMNHNEHDDTCFDYGAGCFHHFPIIALYSFFSCPIIKKKCHRAHYDSCLDSRPSKKHQLLWVPGEELEYGNHSPLDSPSKLRTKECSLPIWWPFFGRDLAGSTGSTGTSNPKSRCCHSYKHLSTSIYSYIHDYLYKIISGIKIIYVYVYIYIYGYGSIPIFIPFLVGYSHP